MIAFLTLKDVLPPGRVCLFKVETGFTFFENKGLSVWCHVSMKNRIVASDEGAGRPREQISVFDISRKRSVSVIKNQLYVFLFFFLFFGGVNRPVKCFSAGVVYFPTSTTMLVVPDRKSVV